MPDSTSEILTVGHSNQSFDQFLHLLTRNGVTAVADVRSQPFSRYTPQFNKSELSKLLHDHGIDYIFLGNELGARSTDPNCYVDGRVQYARLAHSGSFKAGIQVVLQRAETDRVALMCTEKDPLNCHRTILVAKELSQLGVLVQHIHGDGSLESHESAIDRLLEDQGVQPSLFHSREEQVEDALSAQEQKIAYIDNDLAHTEAASLP